MSNKYCQALVELRNKPAHELKEVGAGDVVGEISLVTDAPRTATAKSKSDLKFLGGERMGVMVPVKPSWMEGITLGRPTSNCNG